VSPGHSWLLLGYFLVVLVLLYGCGAVPWQPLALSSPTRPGGASCQICLFNWVDRQSVL
jgi:hypothetical protein